MNIKNNDNISFFGLGKEFSAHREIYLEIAEQILSHGQVLQGNEVKELETKVADLCGRNYGISLNTGHYRS